MTTTRTTDGTFARIERIRESQEAAKEAAKEAQAHSSWCNLTHQLLYLVLILFIALFLGIQTAKWIQGDGIRVQFKDGGTGELNSRLYVIPKLSKPKPDHMTREDI